MADTIHSNFAELKESCRDIFREIIYSDVRLIAAAADSTPFKNEIEVITPKDLIAKVDELLYPKVLSAGQQSCLTLVLSFASISGNIFYRDIQSILSPVGIVDYKTPKG